MNRGTRTHIRRVRQFVKWTVIPILRTVTVLGGLTLSVGLAHVRADEPTPNNPALEAAIKKLKIPGVAIHLPERYIDIDGRICLDKGMLELVACAKGSKEHESIVAVEARPMHIHTALLLIGAEAGNPATRRRSLDKDQRWIDVPPSGSAVDVLLVFPDKSGKILEHPISNFMTRSSSWQEPPTPANAAGSRSRETRATDRQFPTHTFLFAGSRLVEDGKGPRKYLSDESGNVISIVTFGDEMLCLPDIHSDQKDALEWQVNAAGLPSVGTKVTLRLRPRPVPKMSTGNPARPLRGS